MFEVFAYGFMQRALIAGILVACITAVVGLCVVLRRMSALGDGLAHISFGGVALGIFLGLYPTVVALVLCVVAVLGIQFLQRKRVYSEVAISIFYSAGLALGVILLSLSKGFTIDLYSYLFGNILAINSLDIVLMGILAVIVFILAFFYLEKIVFISFDESGARASGLNVEAILTGFHIITAITIVLALKIVGILLVSSLLVIPVASALLISKGVKQSLLVAILLSVVGVLLGLIGSYVFGIASGGSIIAVNILLFLLTFFVKK